MPERSLTRVLLVVCCCLPVVALLINAVGRPAPSWLLFALVLVLFAVAELPQFAVQPTRLYVTAGLPIAACGFLLLGSTWGALLFPFGMLISELLSQRRLVPGLLNLCSYGCLGLVALLYPFDALVANNLFAVVLVFVWYFSLEFGSILFTIIPRTLFLRTHVSEMLPPWRYALLQTTTFSVLVCVSAWTLNVGGTVGLLLLIISLIGGFGLTRRLMDVEIELRRERNNATDAARKLHDFAYTDTLTGIPNRRSLTEQLDAALLVGQAERTAVAVLFCDLDGFKLVNDSLGHPSGDRLLQVIAERLVSSVGLHDIVARPSGDEFVVVLTGLPQELERVRDVVEQIASRLRETVEAPILLEGQDVVVGVSIGTALFPWEHADAETLLGQSDASMYERKLSRRGQARHLPPGEQLQFASRMRRALAGEEFLLAYQPIVDAHGKPVAYEALVRWDDPEQGMLMPKDFLEAAEDSALIHSLGEWVMEQAVADAARWRGEGASYDLHVNVSTRQLDEELPERLDELLARAGFPAESLLLELTESHWIHTPDAIDVLGALRARGIRLAIDDFGTGYAGLSRLHELHADVLKLDRSFLLDRGDDVDTARVIRSLIELGRAFSMRVIVEGVESPAQAALIDALGSNVLRQGFLYGRPLIGGGPRPAAAVDQPASIPTGGQAVRSMPSTRTRSAES